MAARDTATADQPAQKSVFRQLAVSLLNATLMLLIILGLVAILLIYKIQNFTADTAKSAVSAIGQEKLGEITQGVGQLKTMGTRLQEIRSEVTDVCKGKLETPRLVKLNDQLSTLNQNVVTLNANVQELGQKASNAAIDGSANALKDWLGVQH